jgi:hypothetical protein
MNQGRLKRVASAEATCFISFRRQAYLLPLPLQLLPAPPYLPCRRQQLLPPETSSGCQLQLRPAEAEEEAEGREYLCRTGRGECGKKL